MDRVNFSKHYDINRPQYRLFRWVDRKKRALLKKRYQNRELKILDLGCGSAAISSQLGGNTVYGLDVNPSLLRLAEEKGVVVKEGAFERMPFDDSFFDVVLSIDSIEHVASRERAINEIKRVLKKEGELVVFTPAYDSLTWLIGERFVNLITGNPSDHITPFTKESLSYYLKTNFSSVTPVRRINFFLGLYVLAKDKK